MNHPEEFSGLNLPKVRLEIVGNQSLLEDLLEALGQVSRPLEYTLVPGVQGAGSSGERLGDGVWPELNFQMVIYLDPELRAAALESVRGIKTLFPLEGLKVWVSEAYEAV